MIESRYWKEDILKHAKNLKPVKKPTRWSERAQVNFEKEIIVSFFMIRKLIETHKVSSKTKNHKLQVMRCPCTKDIVHELNWWNIRETYDLENEQQVTKKSLFISNQLIHGGVIYPYRDETRNWAGVLTCSDYEKESYIYNIPVSEIIEFFNIVGHDYPRSVSYEKNAKGYYDVQTD